MKEKKQFFIPKNYEKKFEWIPGISGWQHIAFIPVVALDYLVFLHTPFSFSNKVTIIAVSLAFPWIMMGVHPTRENVPLWKHLYWKLRFLSRQRIFHYKKEGYVNVEHVQEIKINIDSKLNGEEKTGNSKKISARLNSGKGDRGRILDNPGQQNGSVPKSVGN